jgi:mRNA-degrading endonuclease toxin of MazEF toxin-antitoxin module
VAVALARALTTPGDVHLVRLDPTLGSEIRKRVLVWSSRPDELNEHRRPVVVAPMTAGGYACPWRIACRFQKRSGFVALDQLRTVDGDRLVKRLGRLSAGTTTEVLEVLQEMFAEQRRGNLPNAEAAERRVDEDCVGNDVASLAAAAGRWTDTEDLIPMIGKAPRRGDRQEPALQTLFRMIVARNRSMASRLLAESPALARQALEVGASRTAAGAFFFDEIAHYAYAGDTPLHIAAAAHQPSIAEELVSKGANVGARNRRGAEPLHYAADGVPGSQAWDPDAQYAIVEFLIAAGANPNSEDKSGVAPLHRAVRTRCAAAVGALLTGGADALRKNKSGSTPLHLAVQNTGRGGSGSAASREEQTEIIRLLLGHGAWPSDKDSAGKSVKDCVRADWIHALLEAHEI